MISDKNIKIAVLDFDGTLIDSNSLKYEAFFRLFPEDGQSETIVRLVLADSFEASRYDILDEIIARRNHLKLDQNPLDVASLAKAYNNLVLAGAKHCPLIPGAREALDFLSSRVRLYISSTTPEDSLKEIIDFRGWTDYFVGVFGYPRKKSTTLSNIIDREKVENSRVVVVGDGESDRISAEENRCKFIPVHDVFPFSEVARLLGDNDRQSDTC